MDIELRAFGPMEIVRAGVGVRIRSRQQQVLLATLLVHRGAVVSLATLQQALWPAAAPARVGKSIQIHVHRLRRALGVAGVVQHRPPGYALALPRQSVDLLRFEDLAQRGRAALVNQEFATAAELLRQAARLYRGPAFEGLDDVDGLSLEGQRLDELRLAMVQDRIAAELALGEGPALVAELDALVAGYPLRERFRAQLMTALYRSGRTADALTAYRDGRQLLIEELGVEPNQECQALEQAIRADDPVLQRPAAPAPPPATSPPPAPRQLPADVPGFTGRAQPQRWLDGQLRRGGAGRSASSPVCAVEGTAGVGKTALVVHWAHRVAGEFPDGQLYVNLRGYGNGAALPPIQALAGFLRALGMPAEAIPADLDEAAAAYRSRLAGRRVLVLLDNAAGAEQVRPLLPGGGGCVVLVTSRDQLAGLVATDGAQRLVLDLLPAGEARALLARTLGAHRLQAEPAAVTELVELCGRLPLALRIAAANLTGGQRWTIADYLAQVRGADRLAALAVTGDEQAAVAAAFDQSYRRLPEPARRLFRLLGLVSGPDMTAEAAGALAGTGPADGRQELATLAAAHLVEEHQPDRYTCHDLLRAYARDRVLAQEPAADREAALVRLHRHYLRTADAATTVLYPHALRLPPAGRPVGPPGRFPDPAAAVGWLDAELPNLVAAARQAAGNGSGATVWLLADVLRNYLSQRAATAEGEALAEAALLAAGAAGHRYAYGLALLSRAGLRYRQGRCPEAITDLSQALETFRGAGWREGQGAALTNLGTVLSLVGRLPEAVSAYTESLALFEQLGSRIGQAGVVGNLGAVLLELGRLREAAEQVGRAVTTLSDLDAPFFEALNHGTLGEVRRMLGEFGAARRSFAVAQSRYREVGDPSGEGTTLLGLAMVHCDTGLLAPARELASAALRIARDTEHGAHEAAALAGLAWIHQASGEPEPARAAGRRALELSREIGDLHQQAEVLVTLATIAPEPGGLAAARDSARAALEIARQAGFRLLEGLALTAAAELSLAGGEPARAAEEGERALAVHRETGHRPGEERVHELLGRALQAAAGDPAAGREHRRLARAIRTDLGIPASSQDGAGAGTGGEVRRR